MTNNKKSDDPIVTRRANTFYIQTGPQSLVEPATLQELIESHSTMLRLHHVNSHVLAGLIRSFDSDTERGCNLTRVELKFLESTTLGLKLDRFASSLGVFRRYDSIYMPRKTNEAGLTAARHLRAFIVAVLDPDHAWSLDDVLVKFRDVGFMPPQTTVRHELQHLVEIGRVEVTREERYILVAGVESAR